MTEQVEVIHCSPQSLASLRLNTAYVCWMHFLGTEPTDLSAIVSSIVQDGCKAILMSGHSAEDRHDQIDDILCATQELDIITVWQSTDESLADFAWDFVNVGYSPIETRMRVVTVFGGDSLSETEALNHLMALIRDVGE